MAAQQIAGVGHRVTIYERMPSPARKFLMAGRGGLNVTHSEAYETFVTRYGPSPAALLSALDAWPPSATLAWLRALGVEPVTGSSGRVFPASMKASPVLRSWLSALGAQGVRLETGHEWQGFDAQGALLFQTKSGSLSIACDAVVLALGGASWPRLGSNGAWVALLEQSGVDVAPLEAANCGVAVSWSAPFAQRFAGQPLKRIALTFGGETVRGEAMITQAGLEGGAVYALSSKIRAVIARNSATRLDVDLRPDLTEIDLVRKLSRPRAKQSTSTFLRKTLAFAPCAIGLLREAGGIPGDPSDLARAIKAVGLTVTGCAGLERAISSSGGVRFAGLDEHYMLRAKPGVFIAGEMIDWDAPTGGYLLQATFATAVAAAQGVLGWLETADARAIETAS